MKSTHVFALAITAILAFAGNSILTRLALATPDITPAMFMAVRLISGALALAAFAMAKNIKVIPARRDLAGIIALFIYALAFTYAYVEMGAASGALILFGVVQLTISGFAIVMGNRPRGADAVGILTAFAGLVWLLLPRASAPPTLPAVMMIIAGIAWGAYTIEGRRAGDPVSRTARNFLGAAVLAAAWVFMFDLTMPGSHGLWLALASGIFTSAFGYVIWYAVLRHITVFTAGALQLLVPAVAALGGYILLKENLPADFLMASVLILGGIALTLKPTRS